MTRKAPLLISWIAISLFQDTAVAQVWKSISYVEKSEILFSWVAGSESVTRCFPGQTKCESIGIEGMPLKVADLDPDFSEIGDLSSFLFGVNVLLPDTLSVELDRLRLNVRWHTRNISSIAIALKMSSGGFVFQDFEIVNDGYHEDVNSSVASWLSSANSDGRMNEVTFVSFAIFIQPLDLSLKTDLTVGSFVLLEVDSPSAGKNHPILASIINGKQLSTIEMMSDYSKWSLKELRDSSQNRMVLPSFDQYGVRSGYLADLVGFQCEKGDCMESELVSRLLMNYLKLYPFIAERTVDTVQFKRRLKRLQQMNLSIDKYFQRLGDLITAQFRDPHFQVLVNRKNDDLATTQFVPIRVVDVCGNVAVLNVDYPELEKIVPPGSVVKAVNGQVLRSASDFIRIWQSAQSDSIDLDLVYADQLEKVRSVRLIKAFTRTSRRLMTSFERAVFSISSDSVAYLQIRKWDGRGCILVANHFEKIIQCRGLVLDLRGNGGGLGDDIVKALGFFIHAPVSLGVVDHYWFEESFVVLPNARRFTFPKAFPVAILVDERTACASEMFLVGMKKRDGTFVVGSTKTAGATAAPTLYRFPSGNMLKMHTRIRSYRLDDRFYREGYGIVPDFIVAKTVVEDSYSFADKVRLAGVALVRRYAEN